ncbi:sensor histidine kinase [Halobacillus karajensis]|uniref:histidine kinase n=1 Tax=Halobacillus karajensis TaxID=195088 RepID=A0A059NXB5_9BACI|nr:HAMP domain-containing sensor histidine kinase [Halobacillus karajensis]CDQ18508.1 Alkaline phosphatase synthesis sensor protein PhoR [Halobacillus karajensis]CDQ23420.1 Alkaline phosphatase synthesis sensor protein PhoR [Halobacillus karajensis]CDQ26902.1 Alkaline phosphatase synthesis sensor protein PhoR [Halobacillus karajensis]
MIYIITTLILVVLMVILTRHYFLKKEIKSTARQLFELNSDRTSKKINIQFYDRDMENLGEEINKQIDLTKNAQAEKRSSENELKQAISYISHDIRTPLTSILGYIQFLESEETPEETKQEYTSIIKNSAKRLKVLLEDFFELSLIEQVDYPLKYEKVELNSLALEVLLGFYDEFNQRNLTPDIQTPDGDLFMNADPSAVKRVIENLTMNAIRYSTGHVTIQLTKENQTVQLTVSNSVAHLNEQNVSHLFDRFYKADHTRTGKGTGLGLPIAKGLMEKMNGNLTAELKDNQIIMRCEWKEF